MTSSPPPDPFDQCPGYHLPDFDPYKSCVNVTNFCSHARDIYNIEMLLRWAIFVIPCCLSFFALFLNIYILYVLVPSLRRMNERSKKKYVFILSRAISSTMSIISIFLLPTMIFLTHFNFWVIALFIIFEMLSFLSLLGGIAGTTLTIYVAVVHPVYYTREMSLRKCVAILFLFWTSAIIVAIGCGIVEAAFMGKYAPFLCDYSSCAEPVLIFGIVCISVAFTLCLGTQSFVIFSLWRHERRSKQRGDFSSTQKAMSGIKRKLFGGFFAFGTMAIFEIASAIMLVNSVSKQDQDYNPCDMLEASGSRLQFVISCVVLTLLWTIGLFFDPIFTLTFDPLFSETVTRHKVYVSMEVFDWLSLYLATICFLISGILNIYCFGTACYTYHFLSEEIRKHYVFVLSRSLSSILAVFCLLVLEITLFTNELSPSFTFYAISFSFYNFSMDSLLLSFIMISLVTYFGVVHSSFYRNRITLKSLYFILGAIWVLSLCLAIPLSLYQAASNVPGPIECDQKYCAKVVEWITFSFACVTLLVTVLLTGFVVISLYWYHFKALKNGIEVPEVTSRARVRLTWTFFALVIFCFIELFPVGMIIGFNQNDLKKCESFYEADQLLIQSVVSSVETFLGSIVFMADPLINIFFDKNISKTVKLQIKWLRNKLKPSPKK
ncbi:unnamed protein product [Caenorhabditis brenneri]